MSNEDKDTKPDLPEDKELEQPVAKPEPEPAKRANKTTAGGVAWLALLLSIVTIGAIAYMAIENWRAQREADQRAVSLSDLTSRMASSGESLTSIDRGLVELAEADAQATSRLELLQSDLQEQVKFLDSLPSRLSKLESSMSALQGVSAGMRNIWLIAEAEYYLQIANAQLQLAGNPHLAALALGMADERIVQLADPALTEVRRAISDELAALDVMQKPDIEGVTLTLASLARVVDSLPLIHSANTEPDSEGELDPDLSGVDRAWASMKNAVSGLVKITSPEDGVTALMTPEAEYFLRTNLILQLQTARLALLRGEYSVFQQSIDDAADWLRQYFNAQSAQVSGALQTLDEIRSDVFTTTTPDISESLRLLRHFQALAGSAQ